MHPHLKQLGLTQLEKALPTLFETARQDQWTYELFLTRAVAAEIEGRDRRAAERRMTAARLPAIKTLEACDFAFQPSLSERLLWELADLSFVQTATNILFLGPPGTGKTHLSIALAVKALAAGYSALFTTLTHLAEALDTASYPGLVRQRLRRYTTPSVLVIDEVGYTKLSPGQAHHFFELVTARYEHGSILLTSNTSFSDWGTLLRDEILATALLDRLLHHAEVIPINGRSYRMKDRRETLETGGHTGKGGHVLSAQRARTLGSSHLGTARLSRGTKHTAVVWGGEALLCGHQE
jgi:DNA replication protein DnaC